MKNNIIIIQNNFITISLLSDTIYILIIKLLTIFTKISKKYSFYDNLNKYQTYTNNQIEHFHFKININSPEPLIEIIIQPFIIQIFVKMSKNPTNYQKNQLNFSIGILIPRDLKRFIPNKLRSLVNKEHRSD